MMIVLTFNVQFKVLTDRNKRGELLPLVVNSKGESVSSGMYAHIYKALLNRLYF